MLVLENISKIYGVSAALRDVSVVLPQASYAVVVGQSGSGKTTLLRAIAGHIDIDGGRIQLAAEDITNIPPHQRPIASVFQQYALFPHLTVARNIAFGLEQGSFSAAHIHNRVGEMLDLVGLIDMEHRKPATLSGGQQQRVALARALAVKPAAIMLDEPLGALDPDLRLAMRLELRRVQRETGVLFLHVSHDREEAWTLADHLLVMHKGKLIGAGPVAELQADPGNERVARVFGYDNSLPHPELPGKRIVFAPDHVQIGLGAWRGEVVAMHAAGTWVERHIRLESAEILRQREIVTPESAAVSVGSVVSLRVPDHAIRVVDAS